MEVTTEPAPWTGLSASSASEGFATSTRPSSRISKIPSSSVEPKRFLTALSTLIGLMPFALEVEHGVDHVLQHPRAGQRALLGDVTDYEHRYSGGLGDPLQERRCSS